MSAMEQVRQAYAGKNNFFTEVAPQHASIIMAEYQRHGKHGSK
jgi:hypothetical protein